MRETGRAALVQELRRVNVHFLNAKILNGAPGVCVLGMPNAWLGKDGKPIRIEDPRHLAKCGWNVGERDGWR